MEKSNQKLIYKSNKEIRGKMNFIQERISKSEKNLHELSEIIKDKKSKTFLLFQILMNNQKVKKIMMKILSLKPRKLMIKKKSSPMLLKIQMNQYIDRYQTTI